MMFIPVFYLPKTVLFPKNDSVCRVGFIIRGGVGDLILAINFIKNFHDYLRAENASLELWIDLIVPDKRGHLDIVRTLARGQEFIHRVCGFHQMPRYYDLLVEIIRFSEVLFAKEKKIARLSPRLSSWIKTVKAFRKTSAYAYAHGSPGYFLGNQTTLMLGQKRLSQADVGSVIGVQTSFRPILAIDAGEIKKRFDLTDPFLTLQRGAGGKEGDRNTKLWPVEKYARLVQLLRRARPDVAVVQLGVEKNAQIEGVTHDLRGKTSFEELMALSAEAACHVDAECGIVHLRHFLTGKPSVVLFGPTDDRLYGYGENFNLRSAGSCGGGCEWITSDYMRRCPRGFGLPPCMEDISPEDVFRAVETVLKSV